MGRVCLITGGTSGIGLATARLMAVGGENVFITGRNTKRGDEAAAMLEESGVGELPSTRRSLP